jgi:predicted transcriptional regulator
LEPLFRRLHTLAIKSAIALIAQENYVTKAIAKELGISVTTVSRALNGYDDVSQETRARVEAKRSAVAIGPIPSHVV